MYQVTGQYVKRLGISKCYDTVIQLHHNIYCIIGIRRMVLRQTESAQLRGSFPRHMLQVTFQNQLKGQHPPPPAPSLPHPNPTHTQSSRTFYWQTCTGTVPVFETWRAFLEAEKNVKKHKWSYRTHSSLAQCSLVNSDASHRQCQPDLLLTVLTTLTLATSALFGEQNQFFNSIICLLSQNVIILHHILLPSSGLASFTSFRSVIDNVSNIFLLVLFLHSNHWQ